MVYGDLIDHTTDEQIECVQDLDLTELDKIEKTIYNAVHDISRYKQLYVNYSFCYE